MNCETPTHTTVTAADRLSRAFFERDVLEVAPACLGLILESHTSGGCTQGRIVEVEAYRGPDDRAAHSFGGRRTPRTEVMFGPAGHAYVFLIYGIHTHLNIVTGAVGEPQAVLIRAVEPLAGVELMHERRAPAGNVRAARAEARLRNLCSGPGKLCQAMDISRRFNGTDLLRRPRSKNTEYLVLRAGTPPQEIATSARIGVAYAGEWAAKPWRFFDPQSPFTSKPRERNS